MLHKYGGSGTIQRFDALCVLSMNIVNEKIYIFLWFWFIILAVATAIHLIVRVLQFFMPDMRQRYIYNCNFVLDKTKLNLTNPGWFFWRTLATWKNVLAGQMLNQWYKGSTTQIG